MFLFSHLHLFSAGCHTGKYRSGIKGLSMLPSVLKVGLCCPWTAALGLLESLRIHWKSWLSNSKSILLWLCKFNTVGHHHFLMPWKHCPMCDWSSVSIPGLSSWLKHLKMIVFIYFGGTCRIRGQLAGVRSFHHVGPGIEHRALGLAGTFTSLVLYRSLNGSLKTESFCILEAVPVLPMRL